MPRSTTLPLWPLHVMFSLLPLWWAVGGFYLFWPVFALGLVVVMVVRGQIARPAGALIWLTLMAVILVSATRLEKINTLFAYSLKFGFVAGAFVVYLYVYNAARSGAPWSRLFQPLCFYWLGMVALGWIGVFKPTFAMTTPVEMLLPRGVAADRGVRAMVHIHATEYNALGRNPFYRTAAPYAYTNNWGTGFALLVPCVIAYLTSVRTGLLRIVLMVSLPFALVPAFLTLNRGMFIGLGAGLLYLGVRALLRGDVRIIGGIVAVGALVWVFTLFVPVVDLITNRTESTDSTSDRADIYLQTLQAVERSPLLGYGAPRMVDTTHATEPLGTQGQVWLIMFSHGIPALLLWLLFFTVVARRLAAAVSTSGGWLSTIPVIALVITPFYGYSDQNLSLMFFAIGLAVAALDGPVNRETVGPPAATSPLPPVSAPA